jgi:hypothetical protein
MEESQGQMSILVKLKTPPPPLPFAACIFSLDFFFQFHLGFIVVNGLKKALVTDGWCGRGWALCYGPLLASVPPRQPMYGRQIGTKCPVLCAQ